MKKIVLASASPARLALLRQVGIEPEVIISHVDEESPELADFPASKIASILAIRKATAVAEVVADDARSDLNSATLVIGCDSVLDFQGQVQGKPRTPGEAAERWRAMRGLTGVLYTGHSIVDLQTGRTFNETAATTIFFADIDDAEIQAYVSTGEPLNVAGAFTIDGLGAPFIDRIEGDPSCVEGLSLPLLRRAIYHFGYSIRDFR
ncbi:MAG TPA: Maf family protein [Candidatus Nanopelagicaceae bacterium]|nr:Maf family protein [Candidatus Nanopelagicaceae bacterium]